MAKTVLIVEDNELNMKLFRDLLEAHGYQTTGTSNGYEALDLVRKLRPDLVLMDIQLPQVSGLEVTRWGTIKADFLSKRTSLEGVYAAGDIVRGASLVVWAIRDGREAAESILGWLDSRAAMAAE